MFQDTAALGGAHQVMSGKELVDERGDSVGVVADVICDGEPGVPQLVVVRVF